MSSCLSIADAEVRPQVLDERRAGAEYSGVHHREGGKWPQSIAVPGRPAPDDADEGAAAAGGRAAAAPGGPHGRPAQLAVATEPPPAGHHAHDPGRRVRRLVGAVRRLPPLLRVRRRPGRRPHEDAGAVLPADRPPALGHQPARLLVHEPAGRPAAALLQIAAALQLVQGSPRLLPQVQRMLTLRGKKTVAQLGSSSSSFSKVFTRLCYKQRAVFFLAAIKIASSKNLRVTRS